MGNSCHWNTIFIKTIITIQVIRNAPSKPTSRLHKTDRQYTREKPIHLVISLVWSTTSTFSNIASSTLLCAFTTRQNYGEIWNISVHWQKHTLTCRPIKELDYNANSDTPVRNMIFWSHAKTRIISRLWQASLSRPHFLDHVNIGLSDLLASRWEFRRQILFRLLRFIRMTLRLLTGRTCIGVHLKVT